MSTNCIRCVVKPRSGTDLLCDDCRELGMRGNILGRISIAVFANENNVTDEQCVKGVEVMREGLDMILKICKSGKHKDPISDITCECNRVKRLLSEIHAVKG